MGRKAPRRDIDEGSIEAHGAKDWAAGPTAVAVSIKRAVEQMGVTRTTRTLLRLNQNERLRLPELRLARPARHRHTAEFCENGAKAVAEEATLRRVDAGVLRRALARRPRRALRLLAGPAGPDHRADGPAPGRHALRADQLGRRVRAGRRPPRPARLAGRGARSTPRAAPRTRRRSRTSCSCAPSAPTTCRTARTCATSRRRLALAETIGIGKGTRHARRRLGRRPDRDRRARTPAPTTRGCSPRWRRPSAAARRSSRSTRCGRPG